MSGGEDLGELRDKFDLMDVAKLLKSIYEAEDSKQAAKTEHEFIMDKLRVAGVEDISSVIISDK